jgi:hypothetical protein
LNWLDRLEKHLGFLAIPNLILGVIAGQAVMTLAGLQHPEIPLLLQLDPAAVASGQWYRLITWILVPDTSKLGLLFAVFWFWLLWVMGRTLEAEWGHFRCSVYLLLGLFLPALGSLLLYAGFGIQVIQTGLYFSLSLQLAFAALVPEFTLYLFFIIPMKMRWWAWIVGVWLLFRAVTGGLEGFGEVVFGVGNYILFFLPGAIRASRQRQQVAANRRVFSEAKREAAAIFTHACAQCGAGREADLRLCTCERCGEDGKFWCAEHLKPHLAELKPAAESPPPLPKKSSRKAAPKTKRKG